jgi:hypothetical protein
MRARIEMSPVTSHADMSSGPFNPVFGCALIRIDDNERLSLPEPVLQSDPNGGRKERYQEPKAPLSASPSQRGSS